MRTCPSGSGVTTVFAIMTAACAATGPRSEEPDPNVCPVPDREFPPTDCALVRGLAVDGNGTPVTNTPIAVDSSYPAAYHYGSDLRVKTDGAGRFETTVYRLNRLEPITTPDTARVELKIYGSPEPVFHDTPLARSAILMRFAPLGRSVAPTNVTVVFHVQGSPTHQLRR
jgi:hypothetical protein